MINDSLSNSQISECDDSFEEPEGIDDEQRTILQALAASGDLLRAKWKSTL